MANFGVLCASPISSVAEFVPSIDSVPLIVGEFVLVHFVPLPTSREFVAGDAPVTSLNWERLVTPDPLPAADCRTIAPVPVVFVSDSAPPLTWKSDDTEVI